MKEVMLVDGLVETLLYHSDAEITESAQEDLNQLYKDDMVVVEKELPLKVVEVELVTEEYIREVMEA